MTKVKIEAIQKLYSMYSRGLDPKVLQELLNQAK